MLVSSLSTPYNTQHDRIFNFEKYQLMSFQEWGPTHLDKNLNVKLDNKCINATINKTPKITDFGGEKSYFVNL